jgi:hypothetical protein
VKTIIYLLVMQAEFLDELRRTAKETGLSTAETIRQSVKLSLPKLLEQMRSGRVANVAPFPNKVARALSSQPHYDADSIQVFMAGQTKSTQE